MAKENKYLKSLIVSAEDALAQEGYLVPGRPRDDLADVLFPAGITPTAGPTDGLYTKGMPETKGRAFLRDTRLTQFIGLGPEKEGKIIAFANQFGEFVKTFPQDELSTVKLEELAEYVSSLNIYGQALQKLFMHAEQTEPGITAAFYRTRLGQKLKKDIITARDRVQHEALARATQEEWLQKTVELLSSTVPEAAIIKVRTTRSNGEPAVLGMFPQPNTNEVRVVTGNVTDSGNKAFTLSAGGRLLCTCGAHTYTSRGQCYHLRAFADAMGGENKLKAYIAKAGGYMYSVRDSNGARYYIPPTAPMAGARLGGRDRFIPHLRKGDSLELVREPDNPRDPFAVSIWTSNRRVLNAAKKVYTQLTPAEQSAFCKINGYLPNNPTRIRVGYIPKNISRGVALDLDAGRAYKVRFTGEFMPSRPERGPSQTLPTGVSWGVALHREPPVEASAQPSRRGGGSRPSSATGTRQR